MNWMGNARDESRSTNKEKMLQKAFFERKDQMKNNKKVTKKKSRKRPKTRDITQDMLNLSQVSRTIRSSFADDIEKERSSQDEESHQPQAKQRKSNLADSGILKPSVPDLSNLESLLGSTSTLLDAMHDPYSRPSYHSTPVVHKSEWIDDHLMPFNVAKERPATYPVSSPFRLERSPAVSFQVAQHSHISPIPVRISKRQSQAFVSSKQKSSDDYLIFTPSHENPGCFDQYTLNNNLHLPQYEALSERHQSTEAENFTVSRDYVFSDPDIPKLASGINQHELPEVRNSSWDSFREYESASPKMTYSSRMDDSVLDRNFDNCLELTYLNLNCESGRDLDVSVSNDFTEDVTPDHCAPDVQRPMFEGKTWVDAATSPYRFGTNTISTQTFWQDETLVKETVL